MGGAENMLTDAAKALPGAFGLKDAYPLYQTQPQAAAFVAFLKSPAGAAIFAKWGLARTATRRRRRCPARSAVERCFVRLDRNHDRSITWQKALPSRTHDFDAMDENNDGRLGRTEFRGQQPFSRFDIDQDGVEATMIFRQLFEPVSSTYTYLLGCETTGQAMLIDPVVNAIDRDLQVLQSLGLTLAVTLETHIHADHITAALHLKQRVGSRIAAPAIDRLPCVDLGVEEGRPLQLGGITLEPLHTPGHTEGHFAYRGSDRLFSGDALLIDGCGRTDFQNGSAATLYASVTGKLFVLPDEMLVYPAHDYQGRRVSSIGQEKARNPRLGHGRTQAEFEAIMAALDLPYPKFIDHAVPGNRACGVCPTDLPEEMRAYCERMSDSPQG